MGAIHFHLAFPQADQHLIDVRVDIPGVASDGSVRDHEFFMPAWTPGSYLIREYARHVEAVAATDEHGQPVAVAKVGKDRWRVAVSSQEACSISYRIWAHELSVRTSFVCHDFAFVHPAATFVGVEGALGEPQRVSVTLQPNWKRAHVALAVDAATKAYLAEDFDALIDSPLLLGDLPTTTFVISGVSHEVVLAGVGSQWLDVAWLAAAFKRVVETNEAFWGRLPYERYTLMHLACGGYGGLEHRASAVTLSDPYVQHDVDQEQVLMGLLAHEHFHAWNIKRMRPRALGPFDYSKEALTTSLWVAEGLTAYYDDLQACRAGLISPKAYLAAVSKTYSQVETGWGRHVQTLGQASLDAWIKFYRPDENSSNTGVSYYAKGALLGFVLDAHIRSSTDNTRSLDDVMRLGYARYSGTTGYSEQEFRLLVDEVAGQSCQRYLAERIDTTLPWDFGEALAHYGLQLTPEAPGPKEPRGFIGASMAWDGNRLMVRQIRRNSPAFEAGINVGDEVVALEGFRAQPGQWSLQHQWLRPGHTAAFTLARLGRLLEIHVTPAARPTQSWRLEPREEATLAQRSARCAWLGADC